MSESVYSSSSEYPSDTSTKTSSSIATHKSVQGEPERDDGSSPMNMECLIQAERITKCLDKLVYQTKLAMCIPALMQENILASTLTSRDLDDVRYIIRQYDNPLSSQSLVNMAAMEDMQAGDVSLNQRLHPELSLMMYTLSGYPALKPHVERLTEKMKRDFATRTSTGPDHVSNEKRSTIRLKHLEKLEEFRNLMVVQMQTTAAEEISALMHTRKLGKSNEECLAKIANDTQCIKEEKEEHEQKMRQKWELIEKLKQEIVLKNHKASVKRKKQVLDSERQMVLATRAHAVKYDMLKDEEVESRDHYDSTLSHSLKAEKQLRDRRRKCETQLQSWVQKYDAEMSVKQVELDEVIQQYNEEVENCKNLKLKLEEQNREFEPLMAEKEEEYHQEMTAKMEAFIIEHAARVIQTAWRQVQLNRDEKKKLLKTRRKMEEDKAAAARKAELEAKKQALLEKQQAKKEKAEAKEAAKAAKLEAKANKEGEEKPAEGQKEK